jgi:hypothetical protein
MLQAMIHLMVFKSKYSFSNQYYNDIVKLIIELIPAKLNMSKDFSTMDTSHRHRGHLQLEGKPHRGNASMDDIDVAAAATFFCATDGNSFVPTFNCSIRNKSKCRTTCLLVHLCLQASFFIGPTQLHR